MELLGCKPVLIWDTVVPRGDFTHYATLPTPETIFSLDFSESQEMNRYGCCFLGILNMTFTKPPLVNLYKQPVTKEVLFSL